MLNHSKIENLKNVIINYIENTEIFDENYIFTMSKNYVKENNIEISKGEIKSIISNLINELKNKEKIQQNVDLYYKNEVEFNNNPIDILIEKDLF